MIFNVSSNPHQSMFPWLSDSMNLYNVYISSIYVCICMHINIASLSLSSFCLTYITFVSIFIFIISTVFIIISLCSFFSTIYACVYICIKHLYPYTSVYIFLYFSFLDLVHTLSKLSLVKFIEIGSQCKTRQVSLANICMRDYNKKGIIY